MFEHEKYDTPGSQGISTHKLAPHKRVEQCICASVFKFFNGLSPSYSSDVFHPADQSRITRRSKDHLIFPLRKSSTGQKSLSYLGPKLWNNLPSNLKSANSANAFKHKIKNHFMQSLFKIEENACIYH